MHLDGIVLPSSKRPPRNHEDVIRTGDYEVVEDEERTLLFTGSTKSMLPPKPAQPLATPSMKAPRAANMNLRGLVRAGQEAPTKMEKTNLRGSVRPRMDAEDRTILRPTSTLPPALQQKIASSSPPPAPRPAAGASVRPAMMPTPYVPMKPAGASVAPVSLSVNAPGGGDRKSDPPGDPPSSVITAKTRIVRARSSMSWAAGLMAVGAVVGLVTAVIARGDADSLIDATATLVDPSHVSAHASGAAAQAAVLPAFLDTASPKAAPAGTDANPAKGACLDVGEATVSAPIVVNTPPASEKAESSKKTAMLQGADPSAAAKPLPPRAAPVAYAHPVSHPAPAAREHESAASGSGGWLANVTPAGAGAPIGRPSKAGKGSGGEFENAAAADALAKAQLEASLR